MPLQKTTAQMESNEQQQNVQPKYDKAWIGSIFWNEKRAKTTEEFNKLAAEMKRPLPKFPWDIPGAPSVKNTSRTLWMYLHMSSWKGVINLNFDDTHETGFMGIIGFSVSPENLKAYNTGLFPVDQVHHKMQDSTDGSYPCQRKTLAQMWYNAGFSERKARDGTVLVAYSEKLYLLMKSRLSKTQESKPDKRAMEGGQIEEECKAMKKPRKVLTQTTKELDPKAEETGEGFKKPLKVDTSGVKKDTPQAVVVIDVDQWKSPEVRAPAVQHFSPVIVHALDAVTKAAEDRAAYADVRLKNVNAEYDIAATAYQIALIENAKAFSEYQRADAQIKKATAEFQRKHVELFQAKTEVRAAYTAMGDLKSK